MTRSGPDPYSSCSKDSIPQNSDSRLGAPQRDGGDAALADDVSRLLALGIILLEIGLAQTIEGLRRPEDFGRSKQPSGLPDLRDREAVVPCKERVTLSWAFSSAISHCLKCFVDPTANLEDSDLLQGCGGISRGSVAGRDAPRTRRTLFMRS
jgi:hypothetical protein